MGGWEVFNIVGGNKFFLLNVVGGNFILLNVVGGNKFLEQQML